jgi:hypothetical protein
VTSPSPFAQTARAETERRGGTFIAFTKLTDTWAMVTVCGLDERAMASLGEWLTRRAGGNRRVTVAIGSEDGATNAHWSGE